MKNKISNFIQVSILTTLTTIWEGCKKVFRERYKFSSPFFTLPKKNYGMPWFVWLSNGEKNLIITMSMDVSSWIFHDPLIVKLDAHDFMKIWCPVFIHILEKEQCVCINGATSSFKHILAGVLQEVNIRSYII